METTEAIQKWRSIRRFKDEPVSKEALQAVLEAGRRAPSWENVQPWHFIVIQEKENLEAVYNTYHREWFRTAPCIIVICGDHGQSWKRKDGKDHCDIDIGIVTDHMTLQATALGLATCWICNFDPAETRRLLDLPGNIEPVVILPLGYPLDEAYPDHHDVKRRPLSEIVFFIGE